MKHCPAVVAADQLEPRAARQGALLGLVNDQKALNQLSACKLLGGCTATHNHVACASGLCLTATDISGDVWTLLPEEWTAAVGVGGLVNAFATCPPEGRTHRAV